VAAEIAEGMRAYTIKVTDVTGVGGHALPGDRVDVVLMRDTTPQAQTRNYVSEVVIQDVRVLGVDLNADLSSTKPSTPTTATLEVTVPDAQKLAVAGDLGKLSLLLRKTGAAEIARTSPMRTSNFVAVGGGARIGGGYRPAAFAGPRLIMIVEGARRGSSRATDPKPSAPSAAAPAPLTGPLLPALKQQDDPTSLRSLSQTAAS
jgi:pilus assembly protein CpaB